MRRLDGLGLRLQHKAESMSAFNREGKVLWNAGFLAF
jgi:hypothetical protein